MTSKSFIQEETCPFPQKVQWFIAIISEAFLSGAEQTDRTTVGLDIRLLVPQVDTAELPREEIYWKWTFSENVYTQLVGP